MNGLPRSGSISEPSKCRARREYCFDMASFDEAANMAHGQSYALAFQSDGHSADANRLLQTAMGPNPPKTHELHICVCVACGSWFCAVCQNRIMKKLSCHGWTWVLGVRARMDWQKSGENCQPVSISSKNTGCQQCRLFVCDHRMGFQRLRVPFLGY